MNIPLTEKQTEAICAAAEHNYWGKLYENEWEHTPKDMSKIREKVGITK